MAKLVEKVYGDALFELALEEGKLDSIWEEVKVIDKLLEENPEFLPTITHPEIDTEERQKILLQTFGGELSDDVMGLLSVMLTKNRFAELPKVLDYFDERAKEQEKIGVVEVSTPTELTADQKERVEKRVLEVTDFASLEIHYKVDKSLLGGMVVRIGDQVLDNSISSKLAAMSRSLAGVRLSD